MGPDPNVVSEVLESCSHQRMFCSDVLLSRLAESETAVTRAWEAVNPDDFLTRFFKVTQKILNNKEFSNKLFLKSCDLNLKNVEYRESEGHWLDFLRSESKSILEPFLPKIGFDLDLSAYLKNSYEDHFEYEAYMSANIGRRVFKELFAELDPDIFRNDCWSQIDGIALLGQFKAKVFARARIRFRRRIKTHTVARAATLREQVMGYLVRTGCPPPAAAADLWYPVFQTQISALPIPRWPW